MSTHQSTNQAAGNTHQAEPTLTDLQPGQAGIVTRLDVQGAERWRLMDLGLIPGTRVVAELDSPLGDPTAYRVRGTLIALRKEQARLIHVKHADDNEE